MPSTFRPTGLPIESILPQLKEALDAGDAAVLCAEPGAGKTTIIPLALLDQPWMAANPKIIMLQPRRVAARAAAERMSALCGDAVGQLVGYRMSLESRVSPQTRIEVVTEGILTRMLQSDPSLPGVGLLIFDEFHERSLQADLGLALALEARDSLRNDLRILVMSATIDAQGLAGLISTDPLTPAPVIRCEGRLFKVEVDWQLPRLRGQTTDWWRNPREWLQAVATLIQENLENCTGNILAFLPGAGEIRQLSQALTGGNADIMGLFGSMSSQEQTAVLRPSSRQKVILATNIAETSLTIDGIELVIDSGLARLNCFDARLGMDRLVTERVSLASSLQRQGRAGRTKSGRCIKLWSADEKLEPWLPPESQRADLAAFVLEAAVWGIRDLGALRLLSPPSAVLWQQAQGLLVELGALGSDSYHPTANGQAMAALPMHPRLAAMMVAARSGKQEGLAAACAAVLTDRDLLIEGASTSFELRVALILKQSDHGQAEIRPAQLERSRELYRIWTKHIPDQPRPDLGHISEIIATAYPDRIGKLQIVEKNHRGQLQASYLLSNGRQALLQGPEAQDPPHWIVAIDADAGDQSARIRISAGIDSEQTVRRIFSGRLAESSLIEWDGLKARLRHRQFLGKLLLEEKAQTIGSTHGNLVKAAFYERLAMEGLNILPWDDSSRQALQRLRWAASTLTHYQSIHSRPMPGIPSPLPSWNDLWLIDQAPNWLEPWLRIGSAPLIDSAALHQAIANLPDWQQREFLDRELPTQLVVPSGSRRPIIYREGEAPLLSVRIQEIFGMAKQPRILGVSLILELLSPANRPLQLTADLEGFWSRTWPEVRKEMRGRYPRHYWPDNPLEAEPTARAKPRGT